MHLVRGCAYQHDLVKGCGIEGCGIEEGCLPGGCAVGGEGLSGECEWGCVHSPPPPTSSILLECILVLGDKFESIRKLKCHH